MKTRIIYEDDTILVIYKPAGIATQTSKIGQPDVVSELKNYLAGSRRNMSNNKKTVGEVYLGIVHRLDQPVEGLLVFGKNREATSGLSAQLARGALNKQYYAVIGGQPSEKEGELMDKLYKSADNRAVVVTGRDEQSLEAKEALLQYRIVGSKSVWASSLKGGHEISVQLPISLADIHIDTGRFHQIRVQMSHHGMALLGDSKYADEETRQLSRQLGVRNVALCAYSLESVHPVTKKKLSFKIKPEGKIFQIFQDIHS